MDITNIVEPIIELLVAVMIIFVIPWVKTKLDNEKRQKILEYVDIAVGCAEQVATAQGWDGTKKKEWVLSFLQGYGFKIDYEEVNTMIENAVLKLHNAIK